MNTLGAVALALAVAQAPNTATPAAPQAPPPPVQAAPPASGATLTLRDALLLAAQRNLDIIAAQARLRQANELTWKAWAGYLPQLTVSGNYTRNQLGVELPFPTQYVVRDTHAPTSAPTGTGLTGDPTNLIAQPDLSTAENVTIQKLNQLGAQAELDQALIAPQLWFLIPNAKRGVKVAQLGTDSLRRDVLFGVAQAYYGVAALKRALDISERLLEIAQRQEKDARVRFQAGTIAKVGLLRAEIDRARAEQDLRRAQNSYESGRISLATLLDRKPDFETVEPPEPPLPADPSNLEETALRARPEVQSAQVQVDIARGNRNAAIARYFPNVGAFGRFQVANATAFTGRYDFWQVGLGLQWQILDGGRRESDIREASARIDEAEALRLSTENRVREEVQQALLDLESARANALKAKEQRDLAAENQRLVDVSYRAGSATAVEQADATAQLRNAEIVAVTESLNAQLAGVRVLRAAGEFDPGKVK